MPTSKPFTRALLRALRVPLPKPAGYAIVLTAVVLVAVVRAAFITNFLPYLFFIPVILLGTLFVGSRAGVAATLLSAALAGWSISASGNPFVLTSTQWVSQALFVVVILGIVALVAELRRTLLLLETLAEARRKDLVRLAVETADRNRLATIVEQSRDFIGYADLRGNIQFVNEAGRRLTGMKGALEEGALVNFFTEKERPRLENEVLPAVLRDGFWTGEMQFRHFVTGEAIPVRYNIFPMTDADGAAIGYGTVTTDLRAEKAAEQQREALTRELAHRMKNTLAMVQAIATQTLRSTGDVAAARDAIGARLTALARAQDILTATSWHYADAAEVVEAAVAPHRTLGDRIVASGPHVELTAQRALGLSLAIHELATNAIKYGALSNETGRVVMSWSTDGNAFHFEWNESGGPPVRSPEGRGFGSKLIERIVAAYFEGTGVLDFRPEGVRFVLDGTLGNTTEMAIRA